MVHGAWCMVALRGVVAGAWCTLNYLTIRSLEVELFMARGSKTDVWSMYCMVHALHGAWCMVHVAWYHALCTMHHTPCTMLHAPVLLLLAINNSNDLIAR